MTEIPEHLLKRSRERRAAMGGDAGGPAEGGGETGGGGDTGASGSSQAPAKAAATPAAMPAHPAPAEAEPPAPPSPMVEAYQKRSKIPFWAMPVLAAIPVWAYVFAGTLSPPPAGEGPEVLGTELYASSGCGGCHGAGGGGGVGPAFTGGAIYETFPDFETHFRWVRLGSAGWQAEVGDTYGATDKPVNGGMPGFGEDTLSDADLFYIVYHERIDLGGEPPSPEEIERLELAAALFEENPEATLEEIIEQVNEELGEPDGAGETEGGEVEGQGDPELAPSDPAEEDAEIG